MDLSEEDKQRIAEEEEYRKKVRAEEQYRAQLRGDKKKKKFPIWIIVLLIFFSPVILAGVLLKSHTPPSTVDADIGKHAYNATNGVYRGKILERKDCTSQPSFKCFVVEDPTSNTTSEAPVVNVEVRDSPPTE